MLTRLIAILFVSGVFGAFPFIVYAAPADTLFQVATAGSLAQGVFDGDYTYGRLATHGDFGIGAFMNLDGEMIALDGMFYRIETNGKVSRVRTKEIVPFAQVVRYDPGFRERVKNIDNYHILAKRLIGNFHNQNIPFAIRIDGLFTKIKLRSLAKQKTPYPVMEVAVAKQTVQDLKNIEGTLVGFWFPAYWSGIAVPGFHLHFISKNKNTGGHVLEVAIKQGVTSLQAIHNFNVYLPSGGTFSRADLSFRDLHKSIKKVEGTV